MTTSESVPPKRQAEIDAAYEAYDRHPLDEPDEWGDLASFHAANLRHEKEMPTSAAAPSLWCH